MYLLTHGSNLKLLIPAGGRLYVADVPRDALRARLVLREVGAASHSIGPKIDAKLRYCSVPCARTHLSACAKRQA